MNMGRESRPDRPGDPRIVLIVEDNAAISTVISWSLRYGDYQPVELANGLEAVRWMEQAALEQRFASIILLDLAMPGMDGRSFLSWLQSSWLNRHPMPAVIITTAERFDTRALPFPPCVKHVIAKPFHVRDLLDVIRVSAG